MMALAGVELEMLVSEPQRLAAENLKYNCDLQSGAINLQALK